MSSDLSLEEIKKEWHGSYKSYAIGFLCSLVLTAVSFYLVIGQLLTGKILFVALIGLAILQASVQLIFFLHLGQEAKPRWETLIFNFMLLILFIVAGGTLWIMYDLDERLMKPMTKEMTHD
jgi:cytochrome o ubiquinol oxidase operon protein cyoD